jgi:membrane protease YdiL (CAAX protease family)
MGKRAEMTDGEDRRLGVVATLGWMFLVFVVAQAVGLAVLAVAPLPSSVAAARYDGKLIALVTLVTNPVQILALMAVARRAGARPLAYLGLVGFSGRDLAIGVAVIAAMIAAIDLYGYAMSLDTVSPFQIEAYESARREGWLFLLGLAVILVGPLGEEAVFRGFLFRGCVQPGVSGVIAVLLLTLVWTGLHFQYDWFGLAQVFLMGSVLAWIRWRSGSTTLAFILHALANAESTVETFLKLGGSA